MKKFSPSLLTLALSSVLLTSTFAYSQINANDKASLGVKEVEESLLFHKSLEKEGSDNVPIWRIPSLLRTKDGVLIAAADKRWQHRGDWGDIDTAIRISHDDGKTWGNITTILDLPSKNGEKSPSAPDPVTFNAWGDRPNCTTYCNSAFLIDAQMVQDKRNGRVFLAVDMFADGAGFFGVKDSGNGRINIDGKQYPILNEKQSGQRWTLRENGEVFDHQNNKTNYRVVTKGDPKVNFKDVGDIYNERNEKLGNIYLKDEKTPFLAVNTAYVWLIHSDDNGKTWSNPIDLSAQVKKDWMKFFGTGPGVGIQTKNGNLLFPIYYTNQHGKQSSALVISKDGGKTWDLGESPNDNRTTLKGMNSRELNWNSWENRTAESLGYELTESQLVELNNGDIKLFMRNKSGNVMLSTSKDGGYTWVRTMPIAELTHGYSQLSVLKYSKKINGKEYIIFSGQSQQGSGGDGLRQDGKLFLGEVQEDGSISWKTDKLAREITSNGTARTQNATYKNGYVYSSMAELGDGSIGLAYENTVDYTTIKYLPIAMKSFSGEMQKSLVIFAKKNLSFSNIQAKMI
ncbi:sialidase family protein [Bisgaard Taxon 45]